MYVIFNLDGSIKEQNINEFIQQDNNEVNTVQVAIVGKEPLTYTMGIRCKLPNDEVVCFSSFETTKITDSKSDTYNGYEFEIPSTVTALAGIVRVNIVCLDSSSNRKLVTYSLYLSVNEGKENDVAAVISEQEYYNLLDHIGGTSVYGTHADGAWTTITISGITKIIPTGEDISNLVNKIQYDASEKTMGELATVIDGSGVVGLNLSGLGSYNGIYFGSIYQSSSNVYFEIERFSHDSTYSKNRWVGSCAASTLISDVLTSSSSYYQPYALNKDLTYSWTSYTNDSTLADLFALLGGGTNPKHVFITLGSFMNCLFFIAQGSSTGTYNFEIENTNGGRRWYGADVSSTTKISEICTLTSQYYKPYALSRGLKIDYDASVLGDSLDSLCKYVGPDGWNVAILNINNLGSGGDNGIYQVFIQYDSGETTCSFEFEKWHGGGGSTGPSSRRYRGSNVSKATTLTSILNTSSVYYQPYAEKKNLQIPFDCTGKTMEDLADFSTEFTVYSLSGLNTEQITTLDGIYLGVVSKSGSTAYFDIFQRLASSSDVNHLRWYGACPTSTLIADVISYTSQWCHKMASNPMTTGGDLIVGGTNGNPTRLPKGTDGQIVKMVNGSPAWENYSPGMQNPMTTSGDLIIGGSNGTPTRLAKGDDGRVLKMVSGIPNWSISENTLILYSHKITLTRDRTTYYIILITNSNQPLTAQATGEETLRALQTMFSNSLKGKICTLDGSSWEDVADILNMRFYGGSFYIDYIANNIMHETIGYGSTYPITVNDDVDEYI